MCIVKINNCYFSAQNLYRFGHCTNTSIQKQDWQKFFSVAGIDMIAGACVSRLAGKAIDHGIHGGGLISLYFELEFPICVYSMVK